MSRQTEILKTLLDRAEKDCIKLKAAGSDTTAQLTEINRLKAELAKLLARQ